MERLLNNKQNKQQHYLQYAIDHYLNLKGRSPEALYMRQMDAIESTIGYILKDSKNIMLQLITNNDVKGVKQYLQMRADIFGRYCIAINSPELKPLFIVKTLELMPLTFYYYDEKDEESLIRWEQIFESAKKQKIPPDKTEEFKKYLKEKITQNIKNLPEDIKNKFYA